MTEQKYTAKLSKFDPAFYIIYLNGQMHRVCPIRVLKERYPNIEIIED